MPSKLMPLILTKRVDESITKDKSSRELQERASVSVKAYFHMRCAALATDIDNQRCTTRRRAAQRWRSAPYQRR